LAQLKQYTIPKKTKKVGLACFFKNLLKKKMKKKEKKEYEMSDYWILE